MAGTCAATGTPRLWCARVALFAAAADKGAAACAVQHPSIADPSSREVHVQPSVVIDFTEEQGSAFPERGYVRPQ